MKLPHVRPPHIHPPDLRPALHSSLVYAYAALKWLPAAGLVGLAGGALGAVFHHAIAWAAAFRLGHVWVLWLLPVGSVLIVLLYQGLRLPLDMGTNLIIEAVHSQKRIPFLLIPAILLGTVATHFFGGSAGREGAALQLGGSLAFGIAGILGVKDKEDRHLLILCGMASVFSALFGTPVTAAVFVLEVISVGRFFYSGMLPCLTASVVAYGLSRLTGGEVVRMSISLPGGVTAPLVLGTAVLAAACALMSIVFCVAIHRTGHYTAQWFKSPYLRGLILGCVLLGLTLLVGNQTYNGAGMDMVERAVAGEHVDWYAFALKMLFTAVTLAAGYKGGEIVPTFFVGAAFGAAVGPLLGLPAGYSAAIGMVALFCGVVNCPFASIFLSVEIFGGEYLIPFALTCALSYILSGYFGLYSSQHILRSKVGTELIDREVSD